MHELPGLQRHRRPRNSLFVAEKGILHFSQAIKHILLQFEPAPALQRLVEREDVQF